MNRRAAARVSDKERHRLCKEKKKKKRNAENTYSHFALHLLTPPPPTSRGCAVHAGALSYKTHLCRAFIEVNKCIVPPAHHWITSQQSVMSASALRHEKIRGRNLCVPHYVGWALIILWCWRRFIQSSPLSYQSPSLSFRDCVCLYLLALYLLLSSSLPLCNGISIGQIATGIQYAQHLIESLIGCLMSACC